jgi:Bacterial capsule synthesis protein PGA_cap
VQFERLKGIARPDWSGPARHLPRALAGAGIVALLCVSGTSGITAPKGTPPPSVVMTPTPWARVAAATPTFSPTAIPPRSFPITVVVSYRDARLDIASVTLSTALEAGKVIVPCEVTEIGLGPSHPVIPASAVCVPAEQITAKVIATVGSIGLLPPGLVTPSVKVLSVDNADLFGGPKKRTLPYQLFATGIAPDAWIAYDETEIRTLISTGDTCPDTGVSYKAVTQGMGWNWVLDGGTAHYNGTKPDSFGWGWQVPIVYRNGDKGTLAALMSDSEVSANDFECPMIAKWIQHDNVKVFTIDPRVAKLLADKGGLKVVTLGSNHITDAGQDGVRQTLDYLDAAGIKHTGAGRTLAEALTPAVVDVRGIKFAFVGWDDITGSKAASDTRPGVAPMTDENVCNSIKAARKVADIVIAMPQWGWPEYHANITNEQVTQRAFFYSCGADGILGSGTHWASWSSILPGPNGPRFAIGSHGNFLFTQTWSRQTMEGVIVEVTFVDKKLTQFRLHPYCVVQGAQPNLIDSKDAAFVLNQVWSHSDIQQ